MQPNQPPQNQQGYPQQPQQPNAYGPVPQPVYSADYLDQIAPPPPPDKFLSGFFGKAVVILGVVFFFAVSVIIALSGQKNTAPTEHVAVRLENIQKVSKDFHRHLKNGNLSSNNSTFQGWLTNTSRDANNLLARAEVKKTQYDKEMVASEKALRDELIADLEDARLSGLLDRTYAREMSYHAEQLNIMLGKVSRTAPVAAFREFSDPAIENLKPIQKSFADFDETKR